MLILINIDKGFNQTLDQSTRLISQRGNLNDDFLIGHGLKRGYYLDMSGLVFFSFSNNSRQRSGIDTIKYYT